MKLSEYVRELEQEMDNLETKNRQLVASVEHLEELNQLEMEKKAILETEILDGDKMKEVIQRVKDENRDLKSELENNGTVFLG